MTTLPPEDAPGTESGRREAPGEPAGPQSGTTDRRTEPSPAAHPELALLPEPELASTTPAYGPASEASPRGPEAAGSALVLGEALIDVVERAGEDPVEHVGGSPANVALGIARLGHAVELATWFGIDERGDRIRQHLETDGVVLVPGSELGGRTSTAAARIGADGAADYTFDLRSDLPALSPALAPTVVHTGSIAAVLPPGAEKIAEAVERFRPLATITYDPNARPDLMGSAEQARPVMERLIAQADVVKVSDEDLAWLAPGVDVREVAGDWIGLGAGIVVVTLGGAGALAVTAGGVEVDVVAPRVDVVDTVGAGDSFMAGIIDGLWRAGLTGAAQREALRGIDRATLGDVLTRAAQVAAITVSRAGANPPHRIELAGR
ncbi:carbohydrate kinase family protein [Georgenia faecalis]|uniref:carbohydrate kinase family protein n=1 Tax=Georgenia faecalis TaxID=2483799 RepID=UPI0024086BD5|nr:PfkB family carbohydrate kinase [Georgenia faecalis]